MKPEEAPLLNSLEDPQKKGVATTSWLRHVVFGVLLVTVVSICAFKVSTIMKENAMLTRRAMALEVQVTDAEATAAKEHADLQAAQAKEQREQRMAIGAWEDEAKAKSEREKFATDATSVKEQAEKSVAKAELELAKERQMRSKAEEASSLAKETAKLAAEKAALAKKNAEKLAAHATQARKRMQEDLVLSQEAEHLAREKEQLAEKKAQKLSADVAKARAEAAKAKADAAKAKKKVDTLVADAQSRVLEKKAEVKGLLVEETQLARKVTDLKKQTVPDAPAKAPTST